MRAMMRPLSLMTPVTPVMMPFSMVPAHRNFAKGGKGKKDKDEKKTKEKAQILEEFDG